MSVVSLLDEEALLYCCGSWEEAPFLNDLEMIKSDIFGMAVPSSPI